MKTEDVAAVYVPLEQLKPWIKNPRKNDAAVQRVADSIKRFGFGAPLLARKENGEIIAGHTRAKAARKLGLKSVPVRYLDVSEHDAHMLALADNKLGELAEWDNEALTGLLRNMTLDETSLAGWTGDELHDLLHADLPEEADTGPQLGGLTYSVVVECADETQQMELLERLESEGLKCKPLIS